MADEPRDGSEKDRNAPTVRELKGPGAPSDTVPDLIGVYVPPRALPEPVQHRTLDLKSVRLSDYVDSRRALTERRLVSPPKPEPARPTLWLLPVIAAALGIVAWLLLREPTPPVAGESTTESLPPPAIAPAKELPPAASAKPNVVVVPTTVPEPPATAAPEATVPEKANAPAPSKSQRSRESEKKRKDPWLE